MELTNFLIGIVEGGHKLRIAYANTPFLLKTMSVGINFQQDINQKLWRVPKKFAQVEKGVNKIGVPSFDD